MQIGPLVLPDRTVEISPRTGGHETTTTVILNGSTVTTSTGVGALSFDIDVRLEGDRRATRRAAALEELGNNPTLDVLTVSGSTHIGVDGYYVASSTRRNPVLAEPRTGDPEASDVTEAMRYTLEEGGSRKNHLLAAESSPSTDLTNPFGADDTAVVGLPSAARRVQAIDEKTDPSTKTRPSPTQTVSAEHGDVDHYELGPLPTDSPILLYDLAYDQQGDVDVGVWDTYGNAEILDEDGVVSWQRVFDTGHLFDPGAECVIENGLLRLRIDEPDAGDESATLAAERWDPTASGGDGAWTAVDLPSYDADLATDWQPVDVDLTRIGQASVHALVEFEAVAGDAAGDIFTLDIRLFRGWDDALVTIPPREEGPLPPALYELVEPFASEGVVDPGVEQTLIARSEVR